MVLTTSSGPIILASSSKSSSISTKSGWILIGGVRRDSSFSKSVGTTLYLPRERRIPSAPGTTGSRVACSKTPSPVMKNEIRASVSFLPRLSPLERSWPYITTRSLPPFSEAKPSNRRTIAPASRTLPWSLSRSRATKFGCVTNSCVRAGVPRIRSTWNPPGSTSSPERAQYAASGLTHSFPVQRIPSARTERTTSSEIPSAQVLSACFPGLIHSWTATAGIAFMMIDCLASLSRSSRSWTSWTKSGKISTYSLATDLTIALCHSPDTLPRVVTATSFRPSSGKKWPVKVNQFSPLRGKGIVA